MEIETKGLETKISTFNDMQNGWMNWVEEFSSAISKADGFTKVATKPEKAEPRRFLVGALQIFGKLAF